MVQGQDLSDSINWDGGLEWGLTAGLRAEVCVTRAFLVAEWVDIVSKVPCVTSGALGLG